MLLLPIIERELRVAARNRRTYFTRLITGLGALAVTLYLIWTSRFMGGGMAGIYLLRAVSYISWSLALFGGVQLTSDSLSSEKREDTLGLLFLTRLKARHIVLGKLLANSLRSVLVLLGVVPILSIPVLLGGVSGTEMARIPVALLTSLFLALSFGLLVSALVRSQKVATALGGLALVFLTFIVPLVANEVEQEWHSPILATLLQIPSPAYSLEWSFSTTIGLGSNFFWSSILFQNLLAVLALAVTCRVIPHSWQSAGAASRIPLWRDTLRRWIHGTSEIRQRRRSALLKINPFLWLSYRDRFAPWWSAAFPLGFLGTAVWYIYYYEIPKPPAYILIFATFALLDLTVQMRVASIAAARLAEDRESGALEMLLSTPVTIQEIIQGQWQAIRRIQLPAYCALYLLYVIVAALAARDFENFLGAAPVFIFFALKSLGDFIVIGYVSMWQGLRVSNARYATGSALFRVVLVPWCVWLGSLPLLNDWPFVTGLLVWSTSSILALVMARRNLELHFREAATDRFMFNHRFSLRVRLCRLPLFPIARLAPGK